MRQETIPSESKGSAAARRHISKRYIDKLPLSNSSAILDLGCGLGTWTLELASRGHSLTAVEQRPRLLQWVREEAARLELRITCILGDITRLRLRREFDVVVNTYTGIIPLQKIVRWTRKDGLAVIGPFFPKTDDLLARQASIGFAVVKRIPAYPQGTVLLVLRRL